MALTFNLPSQIVVQTAAQWAVDATVYSNKRILVTSDEYYGSTDQRKFKIADGTQTWSNLDYMPVSQTLAEVLAIGNLTGELAVTSDNTFSSAQILNAKAQIGFNNGVGNSFSQYLVGWALLWWSNNSGKLGYVNIDATANEVKHTDKVELDAPAISLPQSTASRIVETDASKNLTYAAKNTGYNLNLGTTAGTVLEGNRITQVITNGVTDKAPSEDAVYDALALKLDTNNVAVTDARNRKYFDYNNVAYSYTGTLANTIMDTIYIPAGSMGINSTLNLIAQFAKIGVNGASFFAFYVTTNPSAISGGVGLGYISQSATFIVLAKEIRLVNRNSLSSQTCQTPSFNTASPLSQSTGARTAYTIDFSVDQYLHIYSALGNIADTAVLECFQCYIDNP